MGKSSNYSPVNIEDNKNVVITTFAAHQPPANRASNEPNEKIDHNSPIDIKNYKQSKNAAFL